MGGSMRRIVMFNRVTADGYFAGPAGDLDWGVPDEEQAEMAAKDISLSTPPSWGVGHTKCSRHSGVTLL
jgi:hypothetical protein